MAPTSSTEPPGALAPAQRATLMAVARRSIEHGLATGRPLPVVPSEYHRDLKAVRASFVTLQLRGQLRGCIGHLEAVQPLVVDVSENAFAAAFQDPRFNPLTAQEWPSVDIHLSLLTRPEPMHFQDEADLVRQIQPGVDGLILQDGPNRGTFLPSVWESLPQAADFLSHLKLKAGLPANHWSGRVEVYRYRTESFGEAELT
ncbi:MAG TPA: AmmeMemoRadiSam system protein A [Gammaproteobacteria bacterium]|nr:AmmeMemoRadiSam system protein A [Gammaproteobacteria bacterium]